MAIVKFFSDGRYPVVNVGTKPFKSEVFLNFALRPTIVDDVVEAIKVPANCHITKLYWYVVLGDAGVTGVEIGDGVDPNGYEAAADFQTTGNEGGMLDADAYGATAGHFYAADDTIDIVIKGATADTLKLVLVAEGTILDTDLA
jgi:hypothetical protein